jgi:hypothetical protein
VFRLMLAFLHAIPPPCRLCAYYFCFAAGT